jgi:hypothetical protein
MRRSADQSSFPKVDRFRTLPAWLISGKNIVEPIKVHSPRRFGLHWQLSRGKTLTVFRRVKEETAPQLLARLDLSMASAAIDEI